MICVYEEAASTFSLKKSSITTTAINIVSHHIITKINDIILVEKDWLATSVVDKYTVFQTYDGPGCRCNANTAYSRKRT
jgi:hypothetical protein